LELNLIVATLVAKYPVPCYAICPDIDQTIAVLRQYEVTITTASRRKHGQFFNNNITEFLILVSSSEKDPEKDGENEVIE
jgi:hypothetical protein